MCSFALETALGQPVESKKVVLIGKEMLRLGWKNTYLKCKKLEKEAKYQWELNEYLNRDICQPEGFDAYGYPSELFKLDMERLGIISKRKSAKIIDFTKYIDTNRSTNH